MIRRNFLVIWVLSSEERPRLEIEIWESSACGWWWLRWSREEGRGEKEQPMIDSGEEQEMVKETGKGKPVRRVWA